MPTARELKRLQIKTLTRDKYSVSQIASKLKVGRNTVGLWQNRRSSEDKPRKGRPNELSPVTNREIKRDLIDIPGATVNNVVRILNQLPSFINRKKTISRPTVQQYIQTTDWGRKAYKVPKEPHMSIKTSKIVLNSQALRDRILRSRTASPPRLALVNVSTLLYFIMSPSIA